MECKERRVGICGGTLLLAVLLSSAGISAETVHNHHHLLGQETADNPSRDGYLEVEQAGHQSITQEQTGPPSSCSQTANPMEHAILDGSHKAYTFGGIPDNCGSGYGCQSNYWGEWCRFRHEGPPTCPQDMQEDLQGRLRSAANSGHSWARDILTLRPCEIFPYLEGRTLWVVGDSMSKDFAFALQCFMLEYWDLQETGRWPQNQSTSPNVSDDEALMADLYTELGKLEAGSELKPWYLQWCVPMYNNTRMCFLRANEGSFVAESLMPLLPRLASKEDIVLLNFGLHSNDDGTLFGYIRELEAFGEVYRHSKDSLPQIVWRQTSVQHFTTLLGEWVADRPQLEQRCAPIKSVEIKPDGSLGPDGDPTLEGQSASDMTDAFDTLLRGGRRNVRSQAIMGKLGIPIMHIWNQTVPFWDFHRHYHRPDDGTACATVPCDCTHICFPSWHQMWMTSLQKTLELVGKKGSPRLEVWDTNIGFPIPGLNVPLQYNPQEHFVSTESESQPGDALESDGMRRYMQ